MIINVSTSLKDLCCLLSVTFRLPVFLIKPDGEIQFEFTTNLALNPTYQNDKQTLFTLLKFNPENQYDFPVIRRTMYRENFLSISVLKNKCFEGTVLIGPSIYHQYSDDEITGIIHDNQAFIDKSGLFHFYGTMPIYKRDQFVNIGLTIYYMVNNRLLTHEDVTRENKELEQVKIHIDNPDIEVSKRLQEIVFHHDPLFEKTLLKSIREGRIDEVKKSIRSVSEDGYGVLSKSSFIRSRKNLIITAITLATRAAMEGGLHPEKAYTLSDIFIQRLEELNSVEELDTLNEEALCTFARRVLEAREQRFSKTITTCQNYILNHLYTEISHEELANVVQLNPSYLSVLFKKEVGLSVREYIQKVRVEEAKNLLAYSNTPILEICSWLNFTDQSYFTKVFKKFEGITPKKYREQHLLLER